MPGKKREESSESSQTGGDDTSTDEEYVVEDILRHRYKSKRVQYFVKWEGWSLDESTWEFEENLTNCPEILQRYKEKMAADEEKRQSTSNGASSSSKKPKKARIDSDSSAQSVFSPPSIQPSDAANEDKKSTDSSTDYDSATDTLDSTEEEMFEHASDQLPDMLSDSSDEIDLQASDSSASAAADNTETGFDRGLTAKKVLGVTRYPNSTLWVLVAWENADILPELVPNHVCNEKIPELMIQYYESHLQWKTYEPKKSSAKVAAATT